MNDEKYIDIAIEISKNAKYHLDNSKQLNKILDIDKKIEKVYGNYFTKYGNILIITEMYNLCTTIMFADEY